MTTVRLIADDLTGALDAAAEFVALTGPVDVFWQGAYPAHLPPNAALDIGTRESDRETACRAIAAAVPALVPATIAFKKIDSLIRGQTLPELAACFLAGPWERAVLAPAFPFQGRITRSGQQLMMAEEAWCPVGPDLVGGLLALGVRAQRGEPASPLASGITVFDAESDAELDAVVEHVGGPGAPVLWSGTGGLARALAGRPPAPVPELPRPFLGLFGSDQPATAAQLAACAPHWLSVSEGDAQGAAPLARAIERHGLVLASHGLPLGIERAEAGRRIDELLGSLLRHLPRPGTLIAAGGETLRGLCLALGTSNLEVLGRALPGVPVSRLRGGAWDGVTVVSKSGAFGGPNLLRDLLNLHEFERTAQ